jgi:hypothetical protein
VSTRDELLKQAGDIVAEFNFERVRNVMVFLGWTWRNQNAVPEIEELRSVACNLLEAAINMLEENDTDAAEASSGGLGARAGKNIVELTFQIERNYRIKEEDGEWS